MAHAHQLPTPESTCYHPGMSTTTARPCACQGSVPPPSLTELPRLTTIEYPTPPTSAQAAKRELETRRLPPIPQLDIDTSWVCDMICHLWFATSSYTPSPSFHSFLHKILSATQVSSQSILLAMYYIRLLKATNPSSPPPQPGSESRIAVAALMASNKYLEDHTYTNKTWADVSGIRPVEIETMERELLSGVGWRLHVDEHTWKAWVRWVGNWRMHKMRKAENSRSYRRLPRLDIPPSLVHATSPLSSRPYSHVSPLSSHPYAHASPLRRASSYVTPPSSATRSRRRLSPPYTYAHQHRSTRPSSTYSSPLHIQTSHPY